MNDSFGANVARGIAQAIGMVIVYGAVFILLNQLAKREEEDENIVVTPVPKTPSQTRRATVN